VMDSAGFKTPVEDRYFEDHVPGQESAKRVNVQVAPAERAGFMTVMWILGTQMAANVKRPNGSRP
jgi:hypothetical protein